MEMAK
jgi:Ca2+-binding EF-hand superfamily protein